MIKPAKHGRDHLPWGEDPTHQPVYWARLGGGLPDTITVPDQGTTVIPWRDFSTNAPEVFGTIAGGSSMPFSNTPGDNTLKILDIDEGSFYQGGVFFAKSVIRFEDDGDSYEHGGYIECGNLAARAVDADLPYAVPGYATHAGNSIDPASQGATSSALAVHTPFIYPPGPIFILRAFNGVGLDGGVTGPRDVIFAVMTVVCWPYPQSATVDPRVFGSGI